MMHSGMPIISVSEAEKRVLQALRDKQVECIAPINIEKFIQNHQASIQVMPLFKHKFGVEALIARINPCEPENNNLRVYVDRSIADDGPESHYRIALAEEAAHFIADINTILSVKTIESTIEIHTDLEYLPRERNREMIGRVILAPSHLLEHHVKIAYQDVVESEGFGESLLPTLESKLARVFVMPIEQIRLRLKEALNDLNERIVLSMTARDLTLCSSIYSVLPRENITSGIFKEKIEKKRAHRYIDDETPLFPEDF
jgi:hypothetical protein